MNCTEIGKKAGLFAKLQPDTARKRINATYPPPFSRALTVCFVSSPSLPWQHDTWQHRLMYHWSSDEKTIPKPHTFCLLEDQKRPDWIFRLQYLEKNET